MSEHSIASCQAVVLTYDKAGSKWCPAGEGNGISKVHIYFDPSGGTYRIVGRNQKDKQVNVNSMLSKSTTYHKATDTFHQWRDARIVFGLNFSTKEDASRFGDTALDSVANLKDAAASAAEKNATNSDSPPPVPSAAKPTTSPPVVRPRGDSTSATAPPRPRGDSSSAPPPPRPRGSSNSAGVVPRPRGESTSSSRESPPASVTEEPNDPTQSLSTSPPKPAATGGAPPPPPPPPPPGGAPAPPVSGGDGSGRPKMSSSLMAEIGAAGTGILRKVEQPQVSSARVGREVHTSQGTGASEETRETSAGTSSIPGAKLSFAEEMAAKLKRRQESHDSNETLAMVASPTLRRKPPPTVKRETTTNSSSASDRAQVLLRSGSEPVNSTSGGRFDGDDFDVMKQSVLDAVRGKLESFTEALLAEVDARIEAHRPESGSAEA